MSYQSKRELLNQTTPRYREANHSQNPLILNEFIAAIGYARKYAIQLLSKPLLLKIPIGILRIREPIMRLRSNKLCKSSRLAANFICSKLEWANTLHPVVKFVCQNTFTTRA